MALSCTMTYEGPSRDANGPRPRFQYLVTANPGPKSGTASAEIISLSDAKARGEAQRCANVVSVCTGGPQGALDEAERQLDAKHPGLRKTVSEPRAA